MLKKLIKTYVNLRQWHTRRQIIVFESDDWGSQRMSSPEAYARLSKEYPLFETDYYSKLDTLERSEDLIRLFEILLKHTDKYRRHPVITANTIVANPDFKKIKESDFTEYFFEPFYNTIRSLDDGNFILDLWAQGIQQGLLHPQFHGREHLLVQPWLNELKSGNRVFRRAFDEGVFSVPYPSSFYLRRRNLQAAFDYYEKEDIRVFQGKSIIEGAKIFNEHFGFVSKSFIAPAYTWGSEIEPVLYDCGIRYLQGITFQTEPARSNRKFKNRVHYTGQKNRNGLLFLTRNAFFEPSSNPEFDWVNDCLMRIKKAFSHNQPVMVGVHRVNFIGSLVESNRDRNLILFDELLTKILKNWSSVEFMTSDQLGALIENGE